MKNTFTSEISDLVTKKAGPPIKISAGKLNTKLGRDQGLYDPDISRENLKRVIILRYQVAHFFNELFEKLEKGVEKDHKEKTELSEAIKENLIEEKGESGEMEHGSARKVLLKELGVNADEWSRKNGTLENMGDIDPRVKTIIDKVRSLIENDVLAGYGAMTYWESRGAEPEKGDLVLLLRAFETKYPEFKKENMYAPGDALYHLASHAMLDVEHSKALIDALGRSVHRNEEIESVLYGMRAAHMAWQQFWESIP